MFFLMISPEIYSKVKKPSLKLKLFLTKKQIEAETFRNSQNHRKTIEFHIGSQAPKVPPKIAISHVFVISGGNIL